MKNKTKFLSILLSLVLLLGVFFGSLFIPTDPDLGWHLKYGESFFENGKVLKENTFSRLMPDYKWDNSSWGTDLITYQAFNSFGFLGVSVLSALVIVLTFFFIGKAAKLDIFEKSIIFPLLLYLTLPVNQISFRGQLLSLLFIAIMYWVLSIYKELRDKRLILLLIPFFTIWSNLHGEFVLGLALFGLWGLIYLVKEFYFNYKNKLKELIRHEKFLITALLLSCLSVMINPFGVGVYVETFGHIGDPMQKSVVEWLSPNDFSFIWWHQLMIGMALTLGLALQGTGRKTFDLAPFYLPSFILFIFTFWIRRYAWPFYYSSVFLLKPLILFIKPESKKYQLIVSSVFALCFLVFTIWSKYPFTDFKIMNWAEYCKKSISCSPGAANAVIANKLNNEELLSIYDYGGWLIWNYPQIKPTIDGRMHLWRNEDKYSAFEHYYPIEQNLDDIDKSAFNAVITSKRKPIYNRLIELRNEGKWEAIHVDKYSAVFIRNSPNPMPVNKVETN